MPLPARSVFPSRSFGSRLLDCETIPNRGEQRHVRPPVYRQQRATTEWLEWDTWYLSGGPGPVRTLRIWNAYADARKRLRGRDTHEACEDDTARDARRSPGPVSYTHLRAHETVLDL